MALYIAYNVALSTTTTIQAGRSLTSSAQLTMQLQLPDSTQITLVEFGWTQDIATATASLVELATTDTASTLDTAHSTTTIKPYTKQLASASGLTMATTGTSFGEAAITSNTTVRTLLKGYLPQQYVYSWPLGREPAVGNAATENFLQVRCFTTATVNVISWLIWDED